LDECLNRFKLSSKNVDPTSSIAYSLFSLHLKILGWQDILDFVDVPVHFLYIFNFQAQQLYSKTWKHRQDSLLALTKELQNQTDTTSEQNTKNVSRAVVSVLKKTLNDQVFIVSYLIITYR